MPNTLWRYPPCGATDSNRQGATDSLSSSCLTLINAPQGCQRGTHTNETAYPLGTCASEHTQTHSSARQSTMSAHAVAGASPPPPASCISVAISHADAMCSATERRCACSVYKRVSHRALLLNSLNSLNETVVCTHRTSCPHPHPPPPIWVKWLR